VTNFAGEWEGKVQKIWGDPNLWMCVKLTEGLRCLGFTNAGMRSFISNELGRELSWAEFEEKMLEVDNFLAKL
jgi:hypothetical protein